MILEENQQVKQEDEVEMSTQNFSCPTYKARSLSKKNRVNNYLEEMNHEKGLNHFVSMSCDKQIKIWNYVKQEAVFQYQNGCISNNNIIRIGFRHFLSISGDHGQQLQLIEWNEMKIIQSLNLDEKIIYLDVSQAFISDHTIICGDQKGSLHLLNVDLNLLNQSQNKQNYNQQQSLPLKFIKKIKNKDNSIQMQSVTSICFLEDKNKLAVGGEKGSIYFYNIQKSKIYKHIPKAHSNGRKVSFISSVYQCEKQFIISGGYDQIIKLFDEDTCTTLKFLVLNNPILCGVQIDQQFSVIGEGRHIQLLNLQNLTVESLALHKTRVNVIAFEKEKQNIIIGDINGTLKVWSLKKEQNSIQQQNLQLSQRSKHQYHEYPSTARKSSNNKLIYNESQASITSRLDYSNLSIRYDSNQQIYIKNSLKQSDKKQLRQNSQGRFIQQKQQNDNISNCTSNIDYDISTIKKTTYDSSTQNKGSEITNNLLSNSNRGRNNSVLRSSSGKKITTFIVPLQVQNQMILDSLSFQASQKKGNINESYSKNIVSDKENIEQKHGFESIVNMQSIDHQTQNNLLQNIIQRTHLEDLQNMTGNSQQIQIEKSIQLESTIQDADQIEQVKNESYHDIINQLNMSSNQRDYQQIQSERELAQQNLYYDLIKQEANKNYFEKGYMRPQTPSQSINQYCTEDVNLGRNTKIQQGHQQEYYQIQNNYNNQKYINQSTQQIGKSNMCDPYDISEDDKLKQKLEIEQSNLRNQIKQEVQEFRNSILKAQSSKSLCQSLQEKSSGVIDPTVIGAASLSVPSQHSSNNTKNQQNEQQVIKLENLICNNHSRVEEIININGTIQSGFNSEQNQNQSQSNNFFDESAASNHQSKNQQQDFESQQQVSNIDLIDSNQITQRKTYNSNTSQNQHQQQYDVFKNRIFQLEEQQLFNKQQMDEIKSLTSQNVEENIQIRNEILKIKTKLIENQKDHPQKLSRNLSQSSSKQSLIQDKLSNKQSSNQYLSPQRIKRRLINSYQSSEKRNTSKDVNIKNEENCEVEENQLKRSLRQQINDTISNYRQQSQQGSMRNSQKLSAQKFQTPNNKILCSANESPSKNYVELNKKFVSPLKVNWKYINEESNFSEQIKSSQQNNKMRSLSTDFLGIRRQRELQNMHQQYQEQRQPMERNLNYDYSQTQRNRQYSANNDNRTQSIEKHLQWYKDNQYNQNPSQFNVSNNIHTNSINTKSEDYFQNLQNINAIKPDKQPYKNNVFYTANCSQQNNQTTQNNEYYQQVQNLMNQNIPVQLHSINLNQIKQIPQETKEIKKKNFKQQNISRSEIKNPQKIQSTNVLINHNKFNNSIEPQFILKNYIYNPQNYKLQNFGLTNIKNNYEKNNLNPSEFQIVINGGQGEHLASFKEK